MAFCGKCGSQLHENATFCANCGTPTGVSAKTPAAATPVVATPVTQPVPGPHLEESRGFFSSLFDLSFTSFVTGRIIKFLYILIIIGLALAVVAMVIFAQTQQSPVPVVAIIAAPIVFFLYLILARVQLELIIVLFRMSEHLAEIAQQGRRQ